MFKVFQGRTADDAWQTIAEAFRNGGFVEGRDSRAGRTSEILHAGIAISEPRQRWVTSRRPALNVAFALAEVVWILRGRNDSAFLNYFNTQLPKYAGLGSTYHGAYGVRLRSRFGVDQLERAYLALKNNPESRQIVLQIWDPIADLPDVNGVATSPDIPCNISCLLKVRDGRLDWMQVMRSNDVFRGLPYNIVQFTTLQEVIAGWLGVELGEYHHLSDSLHVYDGTNEEIRRSLPDQCVRNSDDLAVPKPVSDRGFSRLERAIERIISPASCADSLFEQLEYDLLKSHRNIGLILCAEGARRRRRMDLVERALTECNNPGFVALYSAWLARTSSKIH